VVIPLGEPKINDPPAITSSCPGPFKVICLVVVRPSLIRYGRRIDNGRVAGIEILSSQGSSIRYLRGGVMVRLLG